MAKFDWQIAQEGDGDLLASLLEIRQIPQEDRAAFLDPSWELHSFSHTLFANMNAAVARLYAALEKGEKIVIHGDYDADGVCGSSLLYLALKDIATKLNFDMHLEVFLPDREKDGYGLALHNMDQFGKDGITLLVTVDCGISNIKELERAHELGIDSIICDHHQLAPSLPEHAIILHPLAPGEAYPNKFLCGTGVAFKFASALLDEARVRGADFPIGYEKWFLDLVAIATVTDVMPLLGENRTLEKYGLMVLGRSRHPGLKALVEQTGGAVLNTETIGFRIGPRINAAGRIANARAAFDAITSSHAQDAVERVKNLETLNRQRQVISDASYKEAVKMVNERGEKRHAIVVHADYWNPGVVGLIAGKLVTEFGVPTFAFAKVGDHYVGSGRSTGGLHLVEAMKSCGDIFIKFGGHPEACGLTVANLDRLQEFADKVDIFAAGHFAGKILKPELRIDIPWPVERIDWSTLATIEQLQPYGQKNPKPIFVAHNARVKEAKAVGAEGKHLKITLGSPVPRHVSCIGFNLGEYAEQIKPNMLIDFVYQLDRSSWNDNDQIQVQILDITI